MTNVNTAPGTSSGREGQINYFRQHKIAWQRSTERGFANTEEKDSSLS